MVQGENDGTSGHRAAPADPVRVLISYAHDNEAHSELVRTFWTFLRKEGIDAQLDVTAANQRQFWPEWMSEQIRAAAFVIVVASPAYRERAEHRGDPTVGRGVRWEARQLQELLYRDGDDGFGKVVPVVLPGGQVEDLPDWVLPFGGTTYKLSAFTSDAADLLLRYLMAQPLELEPPLGRGRLRPPRPFAAVPPGLAVVVGEIPREPPGFVARGTVDRLATAAEGGRAVVCAVSGLRGVGKTHVAAAYARSRIEDGWELVGWVNAETQDSLLAGLAAIAERLAVADPDGDSVKSAHRLRDYLQTRLEPGVVVFDNATDPDGLRSFLPATGGTQMVITSTDHAFDRLGIPVTVNTFDRGESLAFLRERTGVADDVGAGTVARELGDLPLALAQAAATIHSQHLTYNTYLDRLRRVPVASLLQRPPGQNYPHAAAAALLLSIQATEDGEPTGATGLLLRVLAAMSPDGVRRELLAGLSITGNAEDPEQVDAALARAVAGSLLSWSVTGDAVIMHRLVARVLRDRDRSSGRWPDTVCTVLDLLEPRLFDEEEAWTRRAEGAHLVAQVEALREFDATDVDEAELVVRQVRARSWAVRQLRAAADLVRAIDLGVRTLTDSERVLGPDHPDTLGSRNNLAGAYQAVGRLEQAIPLYEQTLTDTERVLGPDHPITRTVRDNLNYSRRA